LRQLRRDHNRAELLEKLYIYIYIIIIILLLEIFLKDERRGPETLGSDDQGKSPRLLLVVLVFFNEDETSLSLSRSFVLSNFHGKGEREISIIR